MSSEAILIFAELKGVPQRGGPRAGAGHGGAAPPRGGVGVILQREPRLHAAVGGAESRSHPALHAQAHARGCNATVLHFVEISGEIFV